jgi:hypothetical protein
MRRLVPLLALLVVLPADAVAEQQRAHAAAVVRAKALEGVVVLHERPRKIRARVGFHVRRSIGEVTVETTTRGCPSPASSGRRLELLITELDSGSVDEFALVDTFSDALVLPRARSVRIRSDSRQFACADLAQLRKGRQPTVAVADFGYPVRNGGLFSLFLLQQRQSRLDYCGAITAHTEWDRPLVSVEMVTWTLLSRAREVLARWSAHGEGDFGRPPDYVSGTVAAEAGATRRARTIRVRSDADAPKAFRVRRFEVRETTRLCRG